MIIIIIIKITTITLTTIMAEYASVPMETMHMTMKRHSWYIIIINSGITQICREILHVLVDIQRKLNSKFKIMVLKIRVSLSINRIMYHYCSKEYPWAKHVCPWFMEFYRYVKIIDHHYRYTKIHNSIIDIHNSHIYSHIRFIRLNAPSAVHELVSDYGSHIVHAVKLFRPKTCWSGHLFVHILKRDKTRYI